MFNHRQDLQFTTVPEHADALFARRLEDVLGGQYDEIGVAMHYMFQSWDMHVQGKYRDLVFGLGSEQVANVEMLATMIAQLLEHAPASVLDTAVRLDPTVAAVIAGTDLQQAIATGAGPQAADNPWKVASSTVSRNLAADFQTNAAAELNRRMQLSRLYRMTDDANIRYLLSFLLARAAANERLCRSVSAELKEGASAQAIES
ncbi:manganese catalase family protein [Kribbella jiaozuonensis]|uniref:Manganese catalase family protein n=1 Tax=Kribbella jiaozuonensis TaxID=2575441 RepID=A0A4V5UW94_9ACTN|nr:manganese catalase family protein [Kribbella jiaozuonensis]TKK76063.1 manganese catalase family protein [Kribbella jiaozuonensis]